MDLSWLSQPAVIWFIIGLVILIAEIANLSFFLIFFGIGAWLTAIVTYIFPELHIVWQLLIAFSTSLFSLLFFRNKLKQFVHSSTDESNTQAHELDDIFLGKSATVLETIAPPQQGRIWFNGTAWQATAEEFIEKDTVVKIIKKDGFNFIVEKIDSEIFANEN